LSWSIKPVLFSVNYEVGKVTFTTSINSFYAAPIDSNFQGLKHENFVAEFLIRPVWISELETRPKTLKN
jgi:hypothetical protein